MDLFHARRLMLLMGLVFAAHAGRAAEPSAKILFIGAKPDHGYGEHMYMHALGVLAHCAGRTPGVKPVVSQGWPADPETSRDVRAIVVYATPAAELLLNGEHRSIVEALMKNGCGLVTVHWASSVEPQNLERLGPSWLRYLGGTWVSKGGRSGGRSTLRQLIPDHPICRGWQEWEIDDEYYLDPKVADARPLLQVTEKGGKDVVVGWVFDRSDGGRSFATTLGHPYKNFEIESFRRMIVNGILWAAKIEVPTAGADVDVPAEILALPPRGK